MKVDEQPQARCSTGSAERRAGFKILASGMRQCLSGDGTSVMTEGQMEKLFLTLA